MDKPVRNLAPMEALLAAELPEGDGWQYEPKWDGFRCLARRDGEEVTLTSKSGKLLGRYFPEVSEMLRSLKERHFLLDGELIITSGDVLAFEALQLRLHPAESRIRKLAGETPAELMAFDLLEVGGKSLVDQPLRERRKTLERFLAKNRVPGPAPLARDHRPRHRSRMAAPQRRGARRRRRQTPRPALPPGRAGDDQGQAAAHRRLRRRRLPLRREEAQGRLTPARPLRRRGLLHHVGFTSAIPSKERPALTKKLERLDRAARLHRQRARRSEPLEYRADRPMAAAKAGACRRSAL